MAATLIPHCDTLIFDIGDVLYTWSPNTPTPISPQTLKSILSSPTWALYECGKLTEEECYERAASEHSTDATNVARAFEHARESLLPNTELLSFIERLKQESQGKLRVFAMSNISQPDFEALVAKKSVDWTIFDHVFTSAAAGMRKPDLCFYRYVIDRVGCNPATTAFIDDKAENVLSARSLGMHGLVYHQLEDARTTLRSLVGDPIQRGRCFLESQRGGHNSVTETGLVVEENFTQLLLLEATGDRQLVNLKGMSECGKMNFFHGKPLLTTAEFPYDLDTTSLAMTILQPDREVVEAVLEEMLEYRNEDGIILTYFDISRARMDPVVCVNVLTLFCSHNRGAELAPTRNWVFDVLKHKAYLDGTRYYKTPEAFLYFLTRLLLAAQSDDFASYIRPVLADRLRERIGAPGDALSLAMRVIACARMGVKNTVDLQRLLSLQREDGSWGPGEMCKYGSSGITIGNFGLSTALAIQAIEMLD